MVRVKICGITNLVDAMLSVKSGAWALGFIFYAKSPRSVSPTVAEKIIRKLPPFVTPVGVFVNESQPIIKRIAKQCGFLTLQLHGNETPEFVANLKGFKVIKAFRVNESFDFAQLKKFKADAFLFDTYDQHFYGGSGKVFNWNLLTQHKIHQPIILSGGLNAINVSLAIKTVLPFAVDVSSSLEARPGKKDPQKIEKFFDSVKKQ